DWDKADCDGLGKGALYVSGPLVGHLARGRPQRGGVRLQYVRRCPAGSAGSASAWRSVGGICGSLEHRASVTSFPCDSRRTSLVVHSSGRFWCIRHTSLYRDSINLVTRGIMVPYIPSRCCGAAPASND